LLAALPYEGARQEEAILMTPGPPSNSGDNGSPGRDAKGRFAPGNQVARGNPFARRMARLRSRALAAVSGPDLEAIVRQLVAAAKAGDVAAAKVLLPYLLGRPPEAVDPDRLLQPQASASVTERTQELPLAAIARALEEVWRQFQAGTVRGVDARLVKELLLGVLQVRQVVEVARKLDAIQAALEARED
jgi:hypothetical protein